MRSLDMQETCGISIGKAGLLSGPIGLCGICLRRIRTAFRDLDGGTGLLFSVSSQDQPLHFGAGRCSWYPQNNATASTLASDKYFTSRILEHAGVPALGGEYFFLHDRHRAHRPAGHERDDALGIFCEAGRVGLRQAADGIARRFCASRSRRSLAGSISRRGLEILRRDPDPADRRGNRISGFPARRRRPLLRAQISALRARRRRAHDRELLAAHNDALRARGLSPVAGDRRSSLDTVPPKGERWDIPGRMNLSAGGTMVLAEPPSEAPSRWRGRPRARSGFASPPSTCSPISAASRDAMR